MTRRLLMFLALAVLLASCASDDYTPSGPTAEAIGLERYGTVAAADAEAASARVQIEIALATEQAARAMRDHQVTMLTAEAQKTVDAHQRQIEQEQQWATQQAANATQVHQATAQAVSVQATIEAQHVQATATERAWQSTSTAEAVSQRATATIEARSYEATAKAQAVAMAATSTTQAREAQIQATSDAWTMMRQQEHLQMTRQAERREETLGTVRDFGVPLLLFLLAGGVGVLLVYGIRYGVGQAAKRPIVYPRNFLGDAEPMAVPDRDGGYTFVDLDRQPGHVTRVLPSGEAAAPQFRSAGQEERTTARDQAVDGATRPRLGGGPRREAPLELPEAAPPRAPAPGLRSVRVLRRLDQAGRAGYLPPALLASVEADWEEEQ